MFSIIIPYYKKRKYIERCIDAVLAQTYQNFEIILVDDGSQDDVAQLIEEKYSGKVQLIQQVNQGVSAARNAGIAAATHDYIAFLDADDYWSPSYLEAISEIIENDKKAKIIGCKYTRVKSNLEKTNAIFSFFEIHSYFKNQAIKNSLFTSSSTVVKSSFFLENHGFNSNLISGEDIDVWFRAILSGGSAYYINNVLVYYSDEDVNQATKLTKDFNRRFIANIGSMYFENGKKIYSQDFYNFLSKYMYSSLYIIFFQKETHQQAKELKESISEKYFFAELYYHIPYKVGSFFLNKRKIQKLARKYFKFIFTYVHNQ
ncbi:glycosyltransferase family 2 protein [Moheibacter lacus]|uniref:Glycosyltransferase family 2 protein n=1 Tax=Moheibacter lacus TaxID=2745851 RepID=A0A838ZNT0_9FLAO|nr:glycosyltransferase family A protein [Moheibacter lacus]MBA5628937.1 glycosyltransferase family 2 protein [Moheibacter lacus]